MDNEPVSPEVRQHLAEAYTLRDQSRFGEALEQCNAAIRVMPGLAEAHNLRGMILDELGRRDEAIASYREAVRLEPRFEEAQENLREALGEWQTSTPADIPHRSDERHPLKYQLSRISVLQTSKVIAILYAAFGLITVPFGCILLAIGQGDTTNLVVGIIYLLSPILYGVGGFIGTVILIAIYNAIANWIGGIEVEIREMPSRSPQ